MNIDPPIYSAAMNKLKNYHKHVCNYTGLSLTHILHSHVYKNKPK